MTGGEKKAGGGQKANNQAESGCGKAKRRGPGESGPWEEADWNHGGGVSGRERLSSVGAVVTWSGTESSVDLWEQRCIRETQ